MHPLKPRDKKPLLKGWPNAATSNLERLQEWCDQYPQCNWGIATGMKSSLCVVDCDGDEGLDWLKVQVDDGKPLPESWAVHTARGLHLYFSAPAGATIRTSASKIAPGVDVRGEGGFVVAPPSVHPSGKKYTAVDHSCPVSPLPVWLSEAIHTATRNLESNAVPLKRYDVLPKGKRNDGLTRYGGSLRRKGFEEPEIEKKLMEANFRRCSPPLLEAEVRKIAASVSQYEPGGPDPLEQAFQATHFDESQTRYEHFLALTRSLQALRPNKDIALPLVRIATIFDVHFTAVSHWRKKAVATGILIPTGQYRAHRKAGLYRLSDSN